MGIYPLPSTRRPGQADSLFLIHIHWLSSNVSKRESVGGILYIKKSGPRGSDPEYRHLLMYALELSCLLLDCIGCQDALDPRCR